MWTAAVLAAQQWVAAYHNTISGFFDMHPLSRI